MPSDDVKFNSLPEKQVITFTASSFGNMMGLRFLYNPTGDYSSQITITSSNAGQLTSNSVGMCGVLDDAMSLLPCLKTMNR
jgi:hypothetical protein